MIDEACMRPASHPAHGQQQQQQKLCACKRAFDQNPRRRRKPTRRPTVPNYNVIEDGSMRPSARYRHRVVCAMRRVRAAGLFFSYHDSRIMLAATPPFVYRRSAPGVNSLLSFYFCFEQFVVNCVAAVWPTGSAVRND